MLTGHEFDHVIFSVDETASAVESTHVLIGNIVAALHYILHSDSARREARRGAGAFLTVEDYRRTAEGPADDRYKPRVTHTISVCIAQSRFANGREVQSVPRSE